MEGLDLDKDIGDLPTEMEGMQTYGHSVSGWVGRFRMKESGNFLLVASIFLSEIESNCLVSSSSKCGAQSSKPVSCGSLWKMQNLRLSFRPPELEPVF